MSRSGPHGIFVATALHFYSDLAGKYENELIDNRCDEEFAGSAADSIYSNSIIVIRMRVISCTERDPSSGKFKANIYEDLYYPGIGSNILIQRGTRVDESFNWRAALDIADKGVRDVAYIIRECQYVEQYTL